MELRTSIWQFAKGIVKGIYMRDLFKVVVAIVSCIVAAGSFGCDIFNVLPDASWPVVYFTSFIIFTLFMGWGWLSAEKRIRELIESKPNINVTCENCGNLRVYNNGGVAEFRVKAQVIEDNNFEGDDWFIPWIGSNELDQKIYRGDNCILSVARCEWKIVIKGENERIKKPYIQFCTVKQKDNTEYYLPDSSPVIDKI